MKPNCETCKLKDSCVYYKKHIDVVYCPLAKKESKK